MNSMTARMTLNDEKRQPPRTEHVYAACVKPPSIALKISMIVAACLLVAGGVLIVFGVGGPTKVIRHGVSYGTGAGVLPVYAAGLGAVLCAVGGLTALVQIVRLRAANRRNRKLSMGRL